MKSGSGKALGRALKKNFFRGNHLSLMLCLLATAGISFVSIALSYVIQQIVDMISGTEGARSFSTVVIMTVALIAGCVIFGAIDSVFSPKFQAKAMRQYKTDAFARLMKKSIAAFSDENTAAYISAFSNDAATIESNYLGCIWQLIQSVVWFFGAFALMLWYSPLLTLIAVGVSFLPIAGSLLTGGKMAAAEKKVSLRNEGFMGVLKDALSGFAVIKSFKAEKEVGGILDRSVEDTETQKRKRNHLQSIINYIGNLTGVAAQLGVFLIGAALAGQGGGITPGVIMAFINLMGLVVQPIGTVPSLLAKRRSAMALIDKMADMLSADTREEGENVPPALKEGIEITDLSFSYDESTPVFAGINARFEAGKCYAVVGGSGSGKSTLLSLLMASRTGYSGAICYDGKELKTIRSESLYEIVSLIQQNVFVFDSTIRENITLFRPFPEAAVQEAIRLSGLSALIAEKGGDYACGENGAGLSGGERQRISIARALLRKTPVLLVDEATAALDAETAFNVSDSILNLDGLTRIVVTHRLNESLLARYDEIIVLRNGAIQERGSFCDLMANKGYFYSLYTVSQ